MGVDMDGEPSPIRVMAPEGSHKPSQPHSNDATLTVPRLILVSFSVYEEKKERLSLQVQHRVSSGDTEPALDLGFENATFHDEIFIA
jgi:hypothetical protein